MKYQLLRGPSRCLSLYTLAESKTTVKTGVVFGSSERTTFPISKTGYYKVLYTVTVSYYDKLGLDFSGESATALLNKIATPYPELYTDPISGKTVTEPRADWTKASNPVNWGTTERKTYRAWYEKTYNLKNFDWTGIEIHHIQPREYGRTNSTTNLIPIPKSLHIPYTSWFAGY